jgi:uncharacterized protein YqjF (DUF2071 family)
MDDVHTLAEVRHRPWPLPHRRWAMAMSWHDLLFMHWPLPATALREHIPAALAIDTFEGMAWLGVVPFRMSGVRPRYMPALPRVSAFAEINVRTYVVAGGKPGVWFFSLDAADPIAVRVARRAFHLPYFDAHMACLTEGDGIRYASVRTHRGASPAAFRARYQPTGAVYHAAPGTLEHWLTERYCLYAAAPSKRAGAEHVLRGEIHHLRWPLQPAAAELAANTMTAPVGIELPASPPLLHFARRLDVVAWLPQPLAAG